jgi:AmmeMemoRadiSam system protein A
MAGALDGYQVNSELLSYEGPFGVGYAVAKYDMLQINPSRIFGELFESSEIDSTKSIRQKEDPYVKLARESLEYYIKHKKTLPKSKNLISDLTDNKAGVFVSIHKYDMLRGCIGTVSPTSSCIADEIINNAISAGTRDPRFRSVKKKELPYLQYSVDILFPEEPIESFSDLDVKRYGVIVYHNHKYGLLLPNLDGIDTVEEQVSIAKQKAGIRENEPFKMKRFEVIRHH